MSFNEPLTPLEQTPRGSMDSITMSNATGSDAFVMQADQMFSCDVTILICQLQRATRWMELPSARSICLGSPCLT